MPHLNRNEFKEAVRSYLDKVDGSSWNYDYNVEGFSRKISHQAVASIFGSLDKYLSRVLTIADLISTANREEITSEESAYAAIQVVLNQKRLVTENMSHPMEEASSESSSSCSTNTIDVVKTSDQE